MDVETIYAYYLCKNRDLGSLKTPRQWIGESDAFSGLRGQLQLTQCRACGLIFTNPRPAAERLKRFYGSDTYICHTVAGSSSANQKAAYLLDAINTSYSGLKTLLDFGCGGGAFMAAAYEAGWSVKGFEPAPRGRRSCTGLGFQVVATLDELAEEQFGVITLHHVLEHIADPIGTLGNLRALLRRDGLLFIEVPNSQSLRARLATDLIRSLSMRVDERYRAFPIHLMYYTHRTLKRVVKEAGFSVKRAFTVGIGIDEFFVESPSGSRQSTVAPRQKRKSLPRAFMRDAFLRSGLGENLVIMATPAR